MGEIWIFRHVDCEGPGYLAEVLHAAGVPWRLIAIDKDQPVPGDLTGALGLVFMGGPMSVNDPLPWIDAECRLIQEAVARDLPVLGHCLGGQLISKALGGTVRANPEREIGWHEVTCQREAATAAAWLTDIPDRFLAYHWHGETFSIPDGATPILASARCPRQGFVTGRTLALQCHIEMTAPMVREWAHRYRDELSDDAPGVQDEAGMVCDLDGRIAALQAVARRLYQRWLGSVDTM